MAEAMWIDRSDVNWQKRGELTEVIWIGRSEVDWQK